MKINWSEKKAITILLVLFIISSLLISAALVGDVLIRQARMTRGVVNSEAAVYAAETGAEESAYKVLKNHCTVGGDPSDCASSGTLEGGASYSVLDAGQITVENADEAFKSVVLAPDQSFILYLDILGASYPSAGLVVSGANGDVVVLEENVATEEKTETIYTDFSSPITVPISVGADPYPLLSYYTITIHNRGAVNQTYTLNWTGSLPKSLVINNAIGTFKTYQRIIESTFPRWQIVGGS